MEKTRKKIFGVFGLILVAAMTIFAAGVESPETLAVSSVTDTITVRVVGDTPKVDFVEPDSNIVVVSPNQAFKINYENVGTIEFTMAYTNSDGVTQNFTLSDPSSPEYNPDYTAGTINTNINLDNYGYGKFVFTIRGVGSDGVAATDMLSIDYYPIVGNLAIGDDGEVYVEVDYDEDAVKSGIIRIYIDGNESDIILRIPEDIKNGKILVPLDGKLTPGKHIISAKIIGYGNNGEQLGEYNTNSVEYEETAVPDTNIPDTGTPDTGGILESLNISKEDYLITGLIVIFVFGVVAFGIVARSRKDKKLKK